jgi:hypothetical protein
MNGINSLLFPFYLRIFFHKYRNNQLNVENDTD